MNEIIVAGGTCPKYCAHDYSSEGCQLIKNKERLKPQYDIERAIHESTCENLMICVDGEMYDIELGIRTRQDKPYESLLQDCNDDEDN